MVRRSGKPTTQEKFLGLVLEATTTVVEILQANGIQCAVFGSLASKLYGSPRDPQDVDILVFQDTRTPETQILSTEELKQLIYRTRPGDFYLKDPRDQEATYKILIYRPSPSAHRPARTMKQIIRLPDPECKVDILIPGTMYLPHLRPELVQWHQVEATESRRLRARIANAIPLVPFSLLLVHKLQGWDDNRKHEESYKRDRRHKDAKDVKRLLNLTAPVKALVERGADTWNDTELFSEELQELTVQRVRDFVQEFPGLAIKWAELGFGVGQA
ncbi:hypothetical protein BDN70DRAFT_870380 [Pholiota conissans]|uniref:Nucleotidyltransferase n=1 Tax=Pholiota conissans TaxID=109636 RepID=A0A9P5ZH24_9AGAR|nr:hypothetical protein BDN70DRAFT_870380 [Pholiota conissans]